LSGFSLTLELLLVSVEFVSAFLGSFSAESVFVAGLADSALVLSFFSAFVLG
jgi:hypothetical protein